MIDPSGRWAARQCQGVNDKTSSPKRCLSGLVCPLARRQNKTPQAQVRRERYRPFDRGILDGHLIEIGAKLGAKLIFGRVVLKERCDEFTQSIVLRPGSSGCQAAYGGAWRRRRA